MKICLWLCDYAISTAKTDVLRNGTDTQKLCLRHAVQAVSKFSFLIRLAKTGFFLDNYT